MTEKSFTGAKTTGQRLASVWDALPVDLLGDAMTPTKRTNDRPEAAALCEVLKALKAHPAVSWCERMNSGAARVGGRFIRFGFTGCPDVLGMLRDGRLLGVEVKAAKGKLRPEQAVFLERVRAGGGVAFVARDCRDVLRELRTLTHSPA
jgi:hypothetical protein